MVIFQCLAFLYDLLKFEMKISQSINQMFNWQCANRKGRCSKSNVQQIYQKRVSCMWSLKVGYWRKLCDVPRKMNSYLSSYGIRPWLQFHRAALLWNIAQQCSAKKNRSRIPVINCTCDMVCKAGLQPYFTSIINLCLAT